MKRIIPVLLFILILLPLGANARQSADSEGIKREALQGFEEILDLWRDGNYEALFDRTSGSETRESFASRLRNAPLRPACCWEKMRDATATVKGRDSVSVRATIGREGPGDTRSKTKSFKLRREGDVWQVSRGELLRLAEARKGKRRAAAVHRSGWSACFWQPGACS